MHDTSKFNLSISGFGGIPQVYSFELREEILGDDLLTVRFAADGILPGSVVGSEVVFSFGHEGAKEYFNGFATGCRVNQSAGGASAAILRAKPLLHLLGREKKRAVFCGSDAEEIAKKILGRARILSVKCKLKSYHEAALKVQHDESVLAFLQRLFHECGIMEFVRHSERGSELVIIDGADFEASTPGFADIELETTDDGASFHGSGHFPVRPGTEFEAFGGTFVAYSVLHSGSQGAAYGHETESEGYTCRVMAYPKSRLGSLPRRMEPAPHSPGVMIATVDGFGDSPAALDSEGRYIIRLPFDEESHGMASSIPVHLMHNFAGEGCGVHFPLRKGTPVLVAFEDCGMEKPVILGAMPLGAHRGPSTEGNSFQSIVRTSGGMELVFDDNAKSLSVSAPDSISAKSGKGHALEGGELGFEGRDKILAKSGREMALEGGEKLILAVGGVKISLDSGGSLKIDASGDISVKSSGRLALQGSAVEIGGPSSPSPDAAVSASVGAPAQQATSGGNNLTAQSMAPHNLVSHNFAPQNLAPQNAAASAAPQGAVANAQSELSVRKVEGAKETYPRQKIAYKAELSKKRSEMSDEDKRKEIKWAVKVGSTDDIKELEDKKGEKITLDIDKAWESKDILVMARIGNTGEASWKTKVLQDTSKGTLIRGVVGEGEAFTGQEIEYEATNSNKDGDAGSVDGNRDIKWAIKVGKNGNIDKDMLKDRKGERVISLRMREDWSGKDIFVMPYLNSPTETVSVKTRVDGFPMLIARSSQQPGKNGDGTEARDMHCGDMTKEDILKIFCDRHIPSGDMRYISYSSNFGSAGYHFREFKSMATTYFAWDNVKFDEYEFPEDLNDDIRKKNGATHRANLESNIVSMIEHFKNGGGKDYSNPDLTAAVMSHEDTVRFFNEIRKLFAEELEDKKGKIAGMEKDELENGSITLPKYDSWTDRAQGLAIAINGTWAYEAQVTEYQLEKDGTYRGKMKIIIYDHFGLDTDDVKPNKPASNFDGFYSWLALQRWEGFNKAYKPFVTVLGKEFAFKGKLEL